MARLNLLGLVLAVAAAPPLLAKPHANPHECSVSDFEGRFGFQALGFDTRNYPVTPLSLAGSIIADGEGTITYWNDFAHIGLPGGPPKITEMNDFVTVVRSVGQEITYTVEVDCRMTIIIPLPAPAPTLMLQGVLVDGGRTARLLIGSPAFVGTWTADKTADPVAKDVKSLKHLLRRLAQWQGLGNVEESDE